MHHFWTTAFYFCNFLSGTPCWIDIEYVCDFMSYTTVHISPEKDMA